MLKKLILTPINPYKILILFVLLFISCNKQNCENLINDFKTYNEAIELVRKTDFEVEEKTDTESSWIETIEYFSCDKKTGYLIMTTKKDKSYIHFNVPIAIWNKFKNTSSFGTFYNNNLKNNYTLILKN